MRKPGHPVPQRRQTRGIVLKKLQKQRICHAARLLALPPFHML
jgi:hypothetical protein